jgi:Mn2+/Fe2+ NRAMP family transporter
LLAYVVAALTLHIPCTRVALATVAPSLALDRSPMLTIVAVFGTTISPYLFFWQASQDAEEQSLRAETARSGAVEATLAARFRRVSLDTWTGMAFSNAIAFCIVATTAATLHAHGITRIETAVQAAQALRQLAAPLGRRQLRSYRDSLRRPRSSASGCRSR